MAVGPEIRFLADQTQFTLRYTFRIGRKVKRENATKL
jgi:hypothetical protein